MLEHFTQEWLVDSGLPSFLTGNLLKKLCNDHLRWTLGLVADG
jgi:hypothetical protein